MDLPILDWVDLPMVFAWFSHMVLEAMVFGPWFWTRWFSVHGIGCFSTYIYMYCNIEKNIIKNQASSLGFGI